MITKTTSVRVYMYSLHIHSYDQGYDYKIYFSESIYVFAAHTQLWSRLWLQKPLQWEYICIRCTYTAMIKVMITKTTSVRVYMYSLHIHSYDQGYEYKNHFSESIYVFAAHTQLWSRLWVQNLLQWEYICIRCTYTAMIKVMSTKSTSLIVYMYSLHKNDPLQWEYICIRCTYTAMIKVMITKTTSVRVYMYSLHIHSYDQGYEYKIYFSESIYVFAAHTQLWSRLWLQKPLQWEYICIRCTYTAMIKVMITKTTSVRVYMYSLHIHSYDQGYEYKNHFSESIYVFAAHTQLWSRLWLQKPLQELWDIQNQRYEYTSVRVYMYSLHIHSYDQGYDYKKPLQWEYICIRCTYTAMIKVMSTKSTSVRVYMYSLHIHSYDQGYEYKNHFSESIYVFAAHTQLWSRLWVQNLLQWEYICIRCTYTAMINVMMYTSVRVYMYSLHIHSYDQGYEYKIYFSESIYVFAAHTQLWSRLWLQKPRLWLLQWEYICIRCTYTAMIKVMITKSTSVRVYMYSLHIHSYDQGYDYENHSESIYVFAAHTNSIWSRL